MITENNLINNKIRSSGLIDDDLRSYIKQLTKTPLLTAQEEKMLARKIQRGGAEGMRAKDRMVESNMRLVVSLAKQYLNTGIPWEDLIQEGSIGLMTATERFDPVIGTKFSTYATHWIRQAIGRAVDNKAKLIRLPAHVSESLRKIDRAKTKLQEEGNSDPTKEEISEATGLSVRKLSNLANKTAEPLSLDFTLVTMGGSRGQQDTVFSDRIEDVSSIDPKSAIIEKETRKTIKGILSVLDEREQLIMGRRFGVTEEPEDEIGSVLARTAEDLNISRERVRLIEMSALRKLRSAARNQRLKEMAAK